MFDIKQQLSHIEHEELQRRAHIQRQHDAQQLLLLPAMVSGHEWKMRRAMHALQRADGAHGASAREALKLLDDAVGIHEHGGCVRGYTVWSATGLRALPPYLVRPVEYERVARRLNASEMQVALVVRAEQRHTWYYGDVADSDGGGEYAMRAALSGVRFAQRVLQWLDGARARGISAAAGAARSEYMRAIEARERERAVELGTMLMGAELSGGARPDATMLVRMDSTERRACAANNIGFLLRAGGAGLSADAPEAERYYKMAVGWGSASAASNLGQLYAEGARGVERDGARARALLQLALARGERSHAPRNLALLLWRGANNVARDVNAAAALLLLGIREGDESARARCARSLRAMRRTWRFAWAAPKQLRAQVDATLARAPFSP